MDLGKFGAIATIVASCFVIVTVVIYWFQLRAMTKARELESVLVILRYIDDLESTCARWFMYEHAEDIYKLLDESNFWKSRNRLRIHIKRLSEGTTSLEQIEQSISVLNHIALLIEEQYTSKGIVPRYLESTFLRCWEVFQPYIEYTRRGRKSVSDVPSNYARHFENVVKKIEKNNPNNGAPNNSFNRSAG